MKPLQYIILDPIVASANKTSAIIDLRQLFSFSLQAVAGTGSCDGTVQVQVTNDPCLQYFANYVPKNWVDLGNPLTFAQSSVASSQLIPTTNISYVAMRVIFTDTSSGMNTAKISLQLVAFGF